MTPEDLREQRLQLGLSQAALARALGVAPNTVARWERNQMEIRHPELIQLALERLKGGESQGSRQSARTNAPQHNLPREMTSFIGREQEIDAVRRLLATTPLLTLCGPGGCGKTRLALQVARQLVDRFADGICLVELASLNDDQLVPRIVASALGVRERPGWPLLRSLQDALRTRQLLLVLDNCEHLLDACVRLVDALLQSGPGLRVLATSREPLRLAGEVTWTPAPLSFPTRRTAVAALDLERFEATRLFVERAGARLPDFVPTDADSAAIAAICQRFDGLPLAIELAAARVTVMSCAQLASRLDNALPLLTVGRRATPPRQQTLRATIDWSHNLLSPAEQVVFRRLAVFAGGWPLEAPEAICGRDSIVDLDSSVVDLLGRLVDKSLVVRGDVAGVPRFRLLEPIRQYAVERLAEHGELESTRLRHLHWYSGFAQRSSAYIQDPLAPLVQELDNIRAALRWSIDAGEIEAGFGIAGAVWQFWFGRGYYAEGIEWQSQLLARRDVSKPTAAHAFTLIGAGMLSTVHGQYTQAQAWLDEGLRLAEALGHPLAIPAASYFLGDLALFRGDVTGARARYERALAMNHSRSREVVKQLRLGKIQLVKGDSAFEAVRIEILPLMQLARLGLVEGDLARAAARAHEALSLARTTRDTWAVAWALQVLGRAAHDRRRLGQAQALLDESLRLYQEIGYPQGLSYGLTELATLAVDRDDRTRARDYLVQALAIAEKAGEYVQIARVLEELGVVAAASDPSRAVGLAGAAAALRLGAHAPQRDPRLSPADHARGERWLQLARSALGEPRFLRTWQAGTEWPLEVAIHEARSIALAASAPHRLTPREREVATLVAEGQTNQQIADQLVFTEATAKKHVEHILNKLGFHSRAQIVAWHLGATQAAVEITPG